MKYENTAEVGDRIRAYDFEGRDDCYVEGTVVSKDTEGRNKGFAAFVIVVEVDGWPKHVNGGSRVGLTTYVPMESMMDWDGRVVNVKEILHYRM
jgi:hypothetical protein